MQVREGSPFILVQVAYVQLAAFWVNMLPKHPSSIICHPY